MRSIILGSIMPMNTMQYTQMHAAMPSMKNTGPRKVRRRSFSKGYKSRGRNPTTSTTDAQGTGRQKYWCCLLAITAAMINSKFTKESQGEAMALPIHLRMRIPAGTEKASRSVLASRSNTTDVAHFEAETRDPSSSAFRELL